MREENDKAKAVRRKPGIVVALIPLVAMMFLLIVGYGIYHIEPQVLLISAAFLTGCLGLILRFKWEDMQKGIVDSIHKACGAIISQQLNLCSLTS